MYLDNAYLFQGMREETRKKILAASTEQSQQEKVYLFRQGDPAESMYILIEGRVRISVGLQELLAYVSSDPGDVIGWSSTIGSSSYTASAECLAPVKVLKIASTQLEKILQEDPASGMIFFKRLTTLIGRRLMKCYKAALSLHGERDPRSYG